MTVTRRHIQIALGVLWLLDGALQLQSYMFTSGFAHQIIEPAAAGQPVAVAAPVHWAAHLIATAPVLTNLIFALGQLALGAGLLWVRTARWALAGSIAWALSVWLLGEGLGGLAGGHTLLLTGAPGAVLLYAMAAVLAWPRRTPRPVGATGRLHGDTPPSAWAAPVWALLWSGGAVLQLLPGNGAVPAIASSADSAPGPLASADRSLAAAMSAHGTVMTVGLALLMAAVGLGVLAPRPWRTTAACTGIVLALVFWMLGEGAGLLTSGHSTDPNTGPLLVLLAVAVLGAPTDLNLSRWLGAHLWEPDLLGEGRGFRTRQADEFAQAGLPTPAAIASAVTTPEKTDPEGLHRLPDQGCA
ncbi:hypothetical protein [Streptacidiphilus jiangxiensis]|uniref:Uncharacterized protein n=1 Tax=Streptacidiphilus jiangxiensis TaxID=235985 RepID=A0A1H7H533_STRJI|nr:hypothetical protein [Streptacidiphilus jiangxiensis]SEK45338.1 hypothetical protein SAMN05414137_10279 [Streptacidiphilus jiangxiensis]